MLGYVQERGLQSFWNRRDSCLKGTWHEARELKFGWNKTSYDQS